MAFASPLALKIGEGVPEPLEPSPGYAPEKSDDFVEKSTI